MHKMAKSKGTMDANLEKVHFEYVRWRSNGESSAKGVASLYSDGITLNILAEKVTQMRRTNWHRQPKSTKQRKENLTAVLKYLKDTDIDTCDLSKYHLS